MLLANVLFNSSGKILKICRKFLAIWSEIDPPGSPLPAPFEGVFVQFSEGRAGLPKAHQGYRYSRG